MSLYYEGVRLIPAEEMPVAKLLRRLEDGPVRMPMQAGELTVEVELRLKADGSVSVRQLTLPDTPQQIIGVIHSLWIVKP